MKDVLDYDCKMPHHEHDEMAIDLSYSDVQSDVLVCISVPDGGGYKGNASTVTLTAHEMREVMFVLNKYLQARGIMEMKGVGGVS